MRLRRFLIIWINFLGFGIGRLEPRDDWSSVRKEHERLDSLYGIRHIRDCRNKRIYRLDQ